MHNDNSLLHDKVQLRERERWGESVFETQATSAQARRVQLDDVRRRFCLCRSTHYLILLALYAECRTNKSIVCISVFFFKCLFTCCAFTLQLESMAEPARRFYEEKKKAPNDSQLS